MLNHYPYTDLHELNLDWILRKVKEMHAELTDFEAINKITYQGLWDISEQYPAWCVVFDNNIGYLSLKTVPAGILLNNTDYWEQIFNITSPSLDISNRRIVLMSDSYGLLRNTVIPWTDKLITEISGLVNYVVNFSEGSMGFNRPGDQGHTTLQLLQEKEILIPNHDTITDFIILMGANDTLAVSGLETAIVNFATYVKGEYPNAKIHLGFVGNKLGKNTTEVGQYANATAIYKKVKYLNNLSYVQNSESIMHDSANVQADMVHPSDDGSTAIKEFALAVLYGNDTHYTTSIKTTAFTLASGVSFNITEQINDNNVSRNFQLTKLALTVSDRISHDMGDLSDLIIYGNGAYNEPFKFVINDGAGTQLEIAFIISLGKLYMIAPTLTSSVTFGWNNIDCRAYQSADVILT